MAVVNGRIDPQLDVQGVTNPSDARSLVDETNERGIQIGTQQTGNGTSDGVTAPVSNVQTATVAGAGFTAAMVGGFVTIAGMTNGTNNGVFPVTAQGGTTISYVNPAGVVEASIVATFNVHEPYSLRDNVEFSRTDRRLIKGTANAEDNVPTYSRSTDLATLVPANLTNIAGKTTDAKFFTCTRKFENQAVAVSNTLVTLSDTGNLPHATANNRTGVPVQDGADAANLASCYVEIVEGVTGAALLVDGRARGTINCDTGGTAVLPADTETVVLNDGVNAAVTFEFDTNASVVESATLRRVDITGAANEDAVRDALILAINAAPTLNITASSGGAGLVSLINTIGGTAGNVTITETVAAAGFVVSGMSGGLATAGHRIYGFTQAGGSTSPNTVEVRFYSIAVGAPISTANPYTWEAVQPTTIDVYYGFNERLDTASASCFRTTLINGLVGDANLVNDIADIRSAMGIVDGETNLQAHLTNRSNFFVFAALDSNPTVVEAFNALNAQIGNRDYSPGAIANVAGLADGQTITASIEALANAIGSSTVIRVIERLVANVAKNVAHTLPGGNTYTLDGTNNGLNMWVFWRKLLRDPGPNTTLSNDYTETSTTQITPYELIKAGDSINYMIYS